MKAFINRLREWFTVQRRQAIYAAVAALVPVLTMTGLITEGQTEAVLSITSVALAIVQGALQVSNWRPDQIATWFVSGGRLALYSLAATGFAAAQVLGWITPDASATSLQVIATGLLVVASIIGVIFATNTETPPQTPPYTEDDLTA